MVKKKNLFTVWCIASDIVVHYSDKIEENKIIILINEVKADEFDCPFHLFI